MNTAFRPFLAVGLCLLLAVKTLLVPVVCLDFSLHRQEIVNRLCENRFRPALHCNGQCQLAKRMGQLAEKQAQQAAGRQADFLKQLLQEAFDANPRRFVFTPAVASRAAPAHDTWQAGPTRRPIGGIFRPPVA